MNPLTDKQKRYLLDLLKKDREINRLLIADLKNHREELIEKNIFELISTIDKVIEEKEENIRINTQMEEFVKR